MSELQKEQRPLLYDDLSDEDFNTQNYNNPRENTRMKPIICSGRVKNQMKGATAILSHWPGYWWSSLKYWWMGLGMIAIIIFIVYNSIVALAVLPKPYIKAIKPRTSYNSIVNHSSKKLANFDIHMHVFAETVDQINLDDFLPYIAIISNKNEQLKFNLIVVLNEKSDLLYAVSDETKNNLALNSLWMDKFKIYSNNHGLKQGNIGISYISLEKYLDDSPLQKSWRNFSYEILQFIVRALSIWEKGGIALNPIIFTPSSPNPLYMKKVHSLLHLYKKILNNKNSEFTESISHTKQTHVTAKKKLNNIYDIIEALEMESKSDNKSQYNLTEAENNNYSARINATQKDRLIINKNYSDPYKFGQVEILLNGSDKEVRPSLVTSDYSIRKIDDNRHILTNTKANVSSREGLAHNSRSSENITKPNLLPLFLEYLFPKRGEIILNAPKIYEDRKESIKMYNNKILHNSESQERGSIDIVTLSDIKDQGNLFFNYENVNGFQENESETQLTIDLKGYIIASYKSCHAFVGNLLSNAVHHAEEETLTNFIIGELTSFCNGVMTSCKGIDVIIL